MPYAILALLIASIASIQMHSPDTARLTLILAIPLLLARWAREGLLGPDLHAMVTSPPAWKILAVAVFIIAIEVLVDGLALPPMVSRHVRSVMGPVSCGIIILAGEVAYHRYRQRNIASGKAQSNGDTWEM
ncbi:MULTISPECIES: hypothetical protein [unclassified Novosphingobium]|uniref:hypothetical protein n=1 Tax=unclassified Novosphingobium TaxID=2644732 RepID=UPI000F7F51C2|nr:MULTISPECIES: hypothetical protein [unclassified Novosphingobium]